MHAPRFPKPQYESWWVVLGDPDTDELMALKRVSMRGGPNETITNRSSVRIEFVAPERLGKGRWELAVVSDGYLGCDWIGAVDFEVRTDLDV